MRATPSIVIASAFAMALVACGGGGEEQAADSTPADASTPTPAAPSASATPAEIPGGAMSKEEMQQKVCLFTPEEVQAAMGFAVAAGKPELTLAEHGMVSCRYAGKDNDLHINLIWTDPVYYAQTIASMKKVSAGKLEQIAGDPDSAYMQYQGELGGALHYLRRNIMVEVRPMAWSGSSEAEMKAKLLKLPRRP